jgi:DNA polymerase-3 subunit delta'
VRLFDVEHQWPAQRRLQMAHASGRIPHAFLFSGPEGVGRQMLAERFARLLLCAKPAKVSPPPDAPAAAAWLDACGRCDDCILFAAATHPDFHFIHRGSSKFHPEKTMQKRRMIEFPIELIRHFVLEQIAHRPARGRAKVFVVGEAERLSSEAQNSLLKTLEEPPDDTFLLLIATSAERLLPTIRSRCQPVSFGPLPTDFVAEKLASQQVTPADARYLAELSDGSLGLAIRLASQGLLGRRVEVAAMLEATARDPLGTAKRIDEAVKTFTRVDAEEAVDEEDEGEVDTNTKRTVLKTILAMMSCLLRDALRSASGAATVAHDEAAVRGLAARLGRAGAIRAIRAISTAESQIDLNANVLMVLDGLCISLGRCFEGRSAAA